jgi:hypothetical protein
MKKALVLAGKLGVLLAGGMILHPSSAQATVMYSPISLSNYSVSNTVETNGSSLSQSLSGPSSQSAILSHSNTTGPGTSGTSSASIATTVNSQEILNKMPVQSISPVMSITQGLTDTPSAGGGLSSVSASSTFNASFLGTGNRATFYVDYFPGTLSGSSGFSSSLALTVKDTATGSTLAFLDASNGKNGMATTDFMGGAGSPPISGALPGPFFLYFATQSDVTYSISGDLTTNNLGGSSSLGGTDVAAVDIIANTPEPSTIFLLGTGLGLMAFLSARRKRGEAGSSTSLE